MLIVSMLIDLNYVVTSFGGVSSVRSISITGKLKVGLGGLAKNGSFCRDSNCALEAPLSVYVVGQVPS